VYYSIMSIPPTNPSFPVDVLENNSGNRGGERSNSSGCWRGSLDRGERKKEKGTSGYFWREDDLQNAKKKIQYPVGVVRWETHVVVCRVQISPAYAHYKVLVVKTPLHPLHTCYSAECLNTYVQLYLMGNVLFWKIISFLCERWASIIVVHVMHTIMLSSSYHVIALHFFLGRVYRLYNTNVIKIKKYYKF